MISAISDLDMAVILASLSGALCFMLNQKHFNRSQRPVAFFISFTIGMIGSDLTLMVFNEFVPGVYTDERAIGAFICSALVVTITMNVTLWINSRFK
ncbi:phage holin family protein [Enterobacter cloacae complex sp. ECC445]|uniref:putative holin n=1 Tax=Enterobacter cloacae complex TaxID=354276 RepID=UPI00129967E5|nr:MULTISPECIES: putative holin [Enterobacter cloacae complex]MCG0456758.1 phage holin family protein [Enterobacter cloacae complex sp. ECC445]MRG34139.1 hypothetical protein [Enterobacter cancerogenus]QZY39521.1 phage holin family protein [Enterobacter cancerogenus]